MSDDRIVEMCGAMRDLLDYIENGPPVVGVPDDDEQPDTNE